MTLRAEAPLPNAQLVADNQQVVSESAGSPKEEALVHKLPPLVPEIPVAAAAALPQKVDPRPEAAYAEFAVRKGDSLEKIAKAHHTTVDELLKMNQLPSSFLRVGQILKVPTERAMVSSPKIKSAASEKGVASKGTPASAASPEYYTVKVGDNPWTIAMKHHMKVDELLRLNALNEEKARKLKPGDRLRTR
jgi:peptidoglycan endopeptidase LytF